jgi:hypothetical protein
MQPEFLSELPRRVAFDWATRRKPLAGRTPMDAETYFGTDGGVA